MKVVELAFLGWNKGWVYSFTHNGLEYRCRNTALLIRIAKVRGYTHYQMPCGSATKITL